MAYLILLSMPRKPSYRRIAITLPAPELAAADRLAKSQDRSRSWIVAEAIRNYAASVAAQTAERGSEHDTVRPPLAGQRLGASRLNQLKRDLKLTPAQEQVEMSRAD